MFPLLLFTIPVAAVTVVVAIVLVVIGTLHKESAKQFAPLDVVRSSVHFVMLIAVVLALLQIAFASVNYLVPDALVGGGARSDVAEMVRAAVATLFVAGPLLLVVLRIDARAQMVWSRRFMVAIVLLLVALTLAGTLMTLIYNFLAGELGARLLGKAAAVLVLALGVGAYYRVYLVKHAERVLPRATTICTVLLIILLVKGIAGGILLAGGPAQARLERFDDRRLQDISLIQGELEAHLNRAGTLPGTLPGTLAALYPEGMPLDPKTGTPYEYRVGALTHDTVQTPQGTTTRITASFELCATFETEGAHDAAAPMRPKTAPEFGSLPPYYTGTTDAAWDHPIGHHCFARTVYATQTLVEKQP